MFNGQRNGLQMFCDQHFDAMMKRQLFISSTTVTLLFLTPQLKKKKGVLSHNKPLMTAFNPTGFSVFDWESTVESQPHSGLVHIEFTLLTVSAVCLLLSTYFVLFLPHKLMSKQINARAFSSRTSLLSAGGRLGIGVDQVWWNLRLCSSYQLQMIGVFVVCPGNTANQLIFTSLFWLYKKQSKEALILGQETNSFILNHQSRCFEKPWCNALPQRSWKVWIIID